MQNNYNIITNPSPLDQKSVDKHKDFDTLLKRVNSASQPTQSKLEIVSKKTFYWIGGVAATLMIGILVFSNLFSDKNNYREKAVTYFATQPYVNPPIENLAQKTTIIKVIANEGGVYEFPSGSRMVVPKAAFANSYGALISGEVEVHFKEYHDFVDFYLSGIPMEIDINGKEEILESVGMIAVYAIQNGEKLDLIPEKWIEIELKSEIAFAGNTPPDFNIYFLNKEKRAWILKGKDVIELVKENEKVNSNEAIMQQYEKENKELDEKLINQIAQLDKQCPQTAKPKKPEQYDGNSMTFELDFLQPNAGEKNYKGTIWQVLDNQVIEEEIAATIWKDFDLKKQSDGSFLLHLQKKDKEASLKIKPVLVGGDYANAIAQFELQLADYQKNIQERQEDIVRKRKELEERNALEKELADKSFAERMTVLKSNGQGNYVASEIMKRTVINKFRVTKFGIWNCDRPLPLYVANLDGTFQDNHFNKFRQNIVYHTDKSRNTLQRFYLDEIANVQFNSESENLLWLLTSDNKLAVFYPKDFNKIKQQQGEYAFEMNLSNLPVNSEEDVRRILKL